MRRLACLLVLLSLAVNPVVAQEDSWVGKTIITTRYGIKISQTNAKGEEVYIGELVDNLSYEVKGHKGNKLLVATGKGVQGWFDKADAVLTKDAVAHFTDELKKNPRDAGSLQKRAFALELQGELGAALKDLDGAIESQPYDMGGWASRGNLFTVLKQYDRAITDYSLAIRFDKQFAPAYNNRGHVLIAKKDYARAIADFDQAIKLEPKMAYAYSNRGLARFLAKQYDAAVADFAQAEKLDAKNSMVYLHRAKMLATCPEAKYRDGKKALEQAEKAMKLEKNSTRDFQETLAAAHAEAGNFNEAIRLQAQVIQDMQPMVDAEAQARHTLYLQKMPYRQE
jgi:Tfp pilus assembly protein PilF